MMLSAKRTHSQVKLFVISMYVGLSRHVSPPRVT